MKRFKEFIGESRTEIFEEPDMVVIDHLKYTSVPDYALPTLRDLALLVNNSDSRGRRSNVFMIEKGYIQQHIEDLFEDIESFGGSAISHIAEKEDMERVREYLIELMESMNSNLLLVTRSDEGNTLNTWIDH